MWQPVIDCAKQLTINSRLREKVNGLYKLYVINEVEFDQYHLGCLNVNNKVTEELGQALSCSQIMEYKFEVEVMG